MVDDAAPAGWLRGMDLRDKKTDGHTRRVSEFARRLAERMGMAFYWLLLTR